MTNEEAIEILQEERDYAQHLSYVNEAIRIAVNAIEKQMPRKPHEIGFISAAFERCLISYCPRCGTRIASNIDGEFVGGKHQKYCGSCGQRLKW